MSSIRRAVILLIIDAVSVNLAFIIALLLKYEGQIPAVLETGALHMVPICTFIPLLVFIISKLYHRIWEYASLDELLLIVKSTTISCLLIVLITQLFSLLEYPLSIYIIAWVFMTIFVGIPRLFWRFAHDYYLHLRESKHSHWVLIVGAGDAGAVLVREMHNNPQLKMKVIGLVDDDPSKNNMILGGIPVLGNCAKIPGLVIDLHIDEIIIAMPSITGKELREIIETCKQTSARIRILPGIYDLSKKGLVHSLRDIQMEDLLRREAVQVDLDEMAKYVGNKTVLVTGAGGSIGSELCRQLANFSPRQLILLDSSENNLYEIEIELVSKNTAPVIPVLADIRDYSKMESVFINYRPQLVFHAAAFKHVPMMERYPEEAFTNNIIGTRNVADLADKYKVQTFIQVSTDKAVNPTSIMGASKRIAELIVKDINRISDTKFASVRFGNVLGSRGSVIPIFMRQINSGGPVTITHPEMKRYFMTIPEAVQLMIQAGAMAEGGEIFVLDMGEPVVIEDLAKDLIRLAGFEPGTEIEIIYSGIRPGEKLFEELFTDKEEMAATKHQRIFISRKEIDSNYVNIGSTVINITKQKQISQNEIINLIITLIPEYQGERTIAV